MHTLLDLSSPPFFEAAKSKCPRRPLPPPPPPPSPIIAVWHGTQVLPGWIYPFLLSPSPYRCGLGRRDRRSSLFPFFPPLSPFPASCKRGMRPVIFPTLSLQLATRKLALLSFSFDAAEKIIAIYLPLSYASGFRQGDLFLRPSFFFPFFFLRIGVCQTCCSFLLYLLANTER